MVERFLKPYERLIRYGAYWKEYVWHRMWHLFLPFPKVDPKSVKKILLMEFTMIGDIIVASPVFAGLKKLYPNAELHVMVYDKFSGVIDDNPYVDKVIGLDYPPCLRRPKRWRELLDLVKQEDYAMAVMLHHGTISNGLLCLMAGIPYRVGSAWAGLFAGKGWFLTHKAKPQYESTHIVDHNLSVIKTLGDVGEKHKVEFGFGAKEKKGIAKLFKEKNISKSKPIIAIHAGTRHGSHKWFNERFAHVADYLAKKYKAQILFTGDGYDYEHYVQPIQSIMKTKSVYAKTTLKELPALMAECSMLLSIDTGMVHIAAAAGTPVLGLYGSGKPATWAPYGKNCHFIFNEHVACTGCRRTECRRDDYICMDSITTKQVIDEIEKKFEKFLKKK